MKEGGGEEVVSCAHKGGGRGPRLCWGGGEGAGHVA